MEINSDPRWTEYFDPKKSWKDNKPGWHESTIEVGCVERDESSREKYNSIVEWIYDNIPNCERHARWCYGGYYSGAFGNGLFLAKFRYERDFLWFQLTWK